MSTVISAEVMRGGSRGPRATINDQLFIAMGPMRGGSRAPDALIGSSTQVLNVKSWDPDQDDEEVAHGHSVKLNIEALNTNAHEIFYDEAADFATGTFDDTETSGDDVRLAPAATGIDFEDYIVDQWLYTDVHPEDWTHRGAASGHAVRDRLDPVNRLIEGKNNNSKTTTTLDDAGVVAAGTIYSKMYFPSATFYQRHGLGFLLTGSGTVLHGYALTIQAGQTSVRPYRITSQTAWSGLGLSNLGFTVLANTWYHFKIHFWHDDTSAYYQWKCWADGASEPGSYTWGGSDTVYPQDGAVGLCTICTINQETCYFDQFEFDPDATVFPTSGTWESGDIAVEAVDHYSHALVTWDETTPDDTTAAVKARWPGGSWLACTNGDLLPGINYKQSMLVGSTRNPLELQIALATTDTSVTPSVTDIKVVFEPGRDEEFEVLVHGVSNVIADNSLQTWGRTFLSAGSGQEYIEDPDWSDLWIQTSNNWLSRDREIVTATLKYWDNVVDSITFEAEASKYRHGLPKVSWLVPISPRETGPTPVEWTALTSWFGLGHNYEWVILDKGQAIHADARWFCGHYVIFDSPGMVIASILELTDHPGSLLAKAYKRDDAIGQLLVQGRKLDDHPAMVMPAIQYFLDTPGAILIGATHMKDQPGMILMYGVNRDGAIFVNVVDNDTYQALLDAGITFG